MQAEGLQLYKKGLQHRCFPVKFAKFLRTPFVTEHLRWMLLHLTWLLLHFFKKYYLTAISQPCYDVLIIFSSRHIFWCIKSRTCLFVYLSSIVRFSKKLRNGVLYKAENWHTWWYEQYFSKHRFLDVCRCAFNVRTNDTDVVVLLIAFMLNFLMINAGAQVIVICGVGTHKYCMSINVIGESVTLERCKELLFLHALLRQAFCTLRK